MVAGLQPFAGPAVRREQRRSRRKPIRHIGWIATAEDGVLQRCLISDVSDTGARIEVESIYDLPDEFTLLLTRDAKMRRVCRVVWRYGVEAGLQFNRNP
jgi:hypothetical protein